MKNETKVNKVRGIVKVAKLEGDPNCLCLITTSSVYDTKPMHYLSMVSEEVKWMVKAKDIYNKETKKIEPLQFLGLN